MKKDWTYKKLGEVAKVVHGKNQKDVLSEDGQYPIYGSGGNIMGYANDYLCEAGTTILGRKGSINNPMFIEEPFWNVDTAFGISAKEGSNSKYLYYFIKSIDWQEKNTGTTLPSLTQQVVKDVEIPLPPLSEQSRIVSRLDAAFGEIEGLKAKAEAQLREARALFQAALTQEMKPKQGWEEKKLSEIVHPQCSLSYGIVQPGDHIEDGVPVVRPVDFNNQITVSVEGLKRTKKEISDAYKRTILNGGEILFCVRGTTGTMGLASEELKGCNVTRGIVPMFFANNTDLMFVFYQLLSPKLQEEIQKKTTGAALKQINIKDLRNLLLSLPPLSVQQSIVSRLDALSEKVRELEETQKKVIAECDALKQALLREVFE